ncbi:MAG: cardiolipin synthase ClsB [Betaproteobacteria bacterium]|nr:cardiolipin synthase ClsB [Betaproteobacteria bacterium]
MRLQYLDGNRLTLLCSGAEYFPALEEAIREARRELYLETYIFQDDAVGQRITDALCDAGRRGVKVHVLVDGFGSQDLPLAIRKRLLDAQVQLSIFRPNISPFSLRRHRLRRMHRKLAAIDGRVAFIGGINIIDDYEVPGEGPPRFDYAVRIEGPLLRPVQREMDRLWNTLAWLSRGKRPREPAAPVDDAVKGGERAALVVRDNYRHRRDIEHAYLGAIYAAKEDIVIANAYFFPGRRLRQALVRAAARGVRVTLLLQGRVEYLLQHYASRALYGTLLEAGIVIHEYHQSFLHAKVAVFDGRLATVGSSNIDPFSLLLAREANVFVDDAGFAGKLRDSLHQAMQGGAQVVLRTQWAAQPPWRRLPSWIAYGVVRFLMGMVRYGGSL